MRLSVEYLSGYQSRISGLVWAASSILYLSQRKEIVASVKKIARKWHCMFLKARPALSSVTFGGGHSDTPQATARQSR